MKQNREDAELGRLYRATLEQQAENCPGDESLAGVVVGDVAAERRIAIMDHAVRCQACADALRILLDLDAEANPGQSAAARPRSSRWIAVAAAAVLALALLTLPAMRDAGRSEETRAPALRGAAVVATPADGSELGEAPDGFRWTAIAGATGYRFRLSGDDARPVWRSERLQAETATLPDEVRADLPPGEYYWTVEVEGPANPRRLGPFWFRVLE